MDEIKWGDVFLADLGEGSGSEQRGVRPVIIVQNNTGNRYSTTVTVIPVTTKIHKSKGLPTHLVLGNRFGLEETSAAMAEQITTIDKAKLLEYLGRVDDKYMKKQINKIILVQIGLRRTH